MECVELTMHININTNWNYRQFCHKSFSSFKWKNCVNESRSLSGDAEVCVSMGFIFISVYCSFLQLSIAYTSSASSRLKNARFAQVS